MPVADGEEKGAIRSGGGRETGRRKYSKMRKEKQKVA